MPTPKIKSTSLTPLDHGITGVVRQSQTVGAAPLPDFANVAPPETPTHSHLDQLLALPNIDEFIAAKLRPRLDSGEILTPARFRDVLSATLAGLRDAARTNPRAARSLGRAARLLADEATLRDLLQMYRSALVQG